MTKPFSGKKKVTIVLTTGLEVNGAQQNLDGTLVRDEDGYSLSWILPPEDKESIGSSYLIRINDDSDEIRMIRSDDCRLEIVFRSGSSTEGVLSLPQGQMSMRIFTHSIRIPDFDGFFVISEEEIRPLGAVELLLRLEYEIRFSEEESTANVISLQIGLAS